MIITLSRFKLLIGAATAGLIIPSRCNQEAARVLENIESIERLLKRQVATTVAACGRFDAIGQTDLVTEKADSEGFTFKVEPFEATTNDMVCRINLRFRGVAFHMVIDPITAHVGHIIPLKSLVLKA